MREIGRERKDRNTQIGDDVNHHRHCGRARVHDLLRGQIVLGPFFDLVNSLAAWLMGDGLNPG